MKPLFWVTIILALAIGACTNGLHDSGLKTEASVSVSADDFRILEGDNWEGTLNYLNYGSELRSTIPVKLEIKIVDAGSIQYSIQYPGEEQYNAVDQFNISNDGTVIDGKILVDRIVSEDGSLILVTKGAGDDDGKAATIETKFFISESIFRMQKNVRYEDSEIFFNRNEYRFSR